MDLERLFIDALGVFVIVIGLLLIRGGEAFTGWTYDDWLPERWRGRPSRIARGWFMIAIGVLFIVVPRIATE